MRRVNLGAGAPKKAPKKMRGGGMVKKGMVKKTGVKKKKK
jgi:cytochrome c-type biogenesis protein CcmE